MISFVRKWAASYLLDAQRKPIPLQALSYEFTDSKGLRYYGFPTLADLPVNRMLKLQQFALFDDAKISPKSLQEIAEKINEINFAIAKEAVTEKRTKFHAQVASLCTELIERPGYISPKDTFYNMAAVCSIREDESPEQFNEAIHAEKVMEFSQLGDKGYAFFLRNTTFKQLVPSLIGTQESWMNTLQSWERDRQRHEARLAVILQSDEPKSDTNPTLK
jgi:hypothetical protein